ncbi:MAG: alpha-isopropylmalate synthase regulatory domain-containing protein [Lentisphaeria bacterium]
MKTSRPQSSLDVRPPVLPAGQVEVMDTTLRDGEQTQGVSLSPGEKLTLARTLLERLNVTRIEVASAKVSDGEKKAVGMITAWARKAGLLGRVEVLGFCDVQRSADWVGEAGGTVINLLTKGSYRHLTEQLRKTPAQHLADIAKTLDYCAAHGIVCNCYPEAWSTGLREESGNDYARWFIRQLAELPIRRIMLADTLGILSPEQTRTYVGELVDGYPKVHFDFHAHNDYGLATANTLAAVAAGVRGVHVTVNGLGERTGNAPLDEVVVALRDLAGRQTGIEESELVAVSKMVETFSGRRLAANKPICGAAVFTQTAGIHADGDKKGNLYIARLSPQRFNRTTTYALGKLAGKASLDINLDQLGIELDPEQKKLVLDRVIALGDHKQTITQDDLPFIIADVVNAPEQRRLEIVDCLITTTTRLSSTATIKIRLDGREYQDHAAGDGGYDAFMKALRAILKSAGIVLPQLQDYEVHIPPGGKTDALVETTIRWAGGITTRGVDTDQVKAAIVATEKMLNLFLRRTAGKRRPRRRQA